MTTYSNNEFSADISALNTMSLTCHARDLVCLRGIDDVLPLFQRLNHSNQPFVILSNGSNIILPKQLDATVISPTLMGKQVIFEDDNFVYLEVMAGEIWHDFVVETVQKGWYGLENLALIPSWVGASPVQNIGAYGVQVEDLIESVCAFHIPTLTFKTLSKKECQFGYRDSIFKKQIGNWLILSVTFKLHKKAVVNTKYGDVAQVASEIAKHSGNNTVSPYDVMQAIIQIRQSKIPDTKSLANCGSFFKNPIVKKTLADKIKLTFPDLIEYPIKTQNMPTDDEVYVKLPAGWLIDKAGLKGKGFFPILTHVHQALILTNHTPLQATQSHIESTMQLIQDTVEQVFAVRLEPEPVWIENDGSIRQVR